MGGGAGSKFPQPHLPGPRSKQARGEERRGAARCAWPQPLAGPCWRSEAAETGVQKQTGPAGCPLDLLQFAGALRPGRATWYKWGAGAGRAFPPQCGAAACGCPSLRSQPASQATRGAAREPPAPSPWAVRGPRCCRGCCCCWRSPAPGRVSGAARPGGRGGLGPGKRGWGGRGPGPAVARPRTTQLGGGESAGRGEGSPEPASLQRRQRAPCPGDPGPPGRGEKTQRCLSPFLTEDEVLENASPSCPSKAFPHWAGKGAPSPQPLLLHLSSLRCWDAMMGVHGSEPQEASSVGLCPPPRDLNSFCLHFYSVPSAWPGAGTVTLWARGHSTESHHRLFISG